MILITGGTGFVGQHLIPILVSQGFSVRLLIRPSKSSPRIPKGVTVEMAVCSINDQRGLRAALNGIDAVIHLLSTEREGSNADFNGIDLQGSKNLIDAIKSVRPVPIIFLSHLKAMRTSAYPVFKVKAIIEGLIESSGLPYLIIRSALMYGKGDQFTYPLVKYIRSIPFVIGLPEKGISLMQPISVMDVSHCLSLCLNDETLRSRVIEIGGLEYFSYKQVMEIIITKLHINRQFMNISPSVARNLSLVGEQVFGKAIIPLYFWDYLAENHTCALDSTTRLFGIIPSRFEHSLDYLLLNQGKIL